ncbi:MAG: hypothetical protein WAS23_07505, partial [Dokdonella sp.]|uniref:hypothetical protein n=1 Tax=Dokdonella sp. TaxID=2291710 RepID=UPI003BAE2C75
MNKGLVTFVLFVLHDITIVSTAVIQNAINLLNFISSFNGSFKNVSRLFIKASTAKYKKLRNKKDFLVTGYR